MADQNQNTITGTLRTLKTDLSGDKTAPQDRLQQAGNFVQARPDLSSPVTPPNNLSSGVKTQTQSTSTPKQDVPVNNNFKNESKNYSWTNMSVPTPNKSNIGGVVSPTNSINPSVGSEVKAYGMSESNSNQPLTNMNDSISSSNSDRFQGPSSSSIVKPKPIPPFKEVVKESPSLNSNTDSLSSGFSALDENLDLPLDTATSASVSSSSSGLGVVDFEDNSISKSLDSNLNPTNTPSVSPEFSFNPSSLDDDVLKTKSKSKFGLVIVMVLLSLIGGGVYYYFDRTGFLPSTQVSNTDTENNVTQDNTDTITEPTENSSAPLFSPSSKINVAFVDTEPIRKTILSTLSSQKDPLVEINLTKDGNPISIIDLASVLGITMPPAIINNIVDYRIYAYNQQGVYKFTATLQLNVNQDTKSLVDSWSTSMPRDLSGFSLNVPSRIVNSPDIKTSTVTNANGAVFNNYYYNYTSPTDSLDVSSSGSYIIMASSQESMKYLLDQIK